MEKIRARDLIDAYWTTIMSDLTLYLVLAGGLFLLYGFAMVHIRRRKRAHVAPRVYEVPGVGGVPADDVLDIPAIQISTVSRPADRQFFHAVLEYARRKKQENQALVPAEHFAIGEMAFLDVVFGRAGLDHLDSFADGLPYKGFELRRALVEIGAPGFGDLIERAVAVRLHRQQLLADMMATGMPKAQALAHPELPTYTALQQQIERNGGSSHFIEKANAYFETNYPWDEGG